MEHLGALNVNIENHPNTLLPIRFDLTPQGAVVVAENNGMFEKCPRRPYLVKVLRVQKW